MSSQRAAGVYCHRSSCQPFHYVAGVVRVEEAVSCVDSFAGLNSYSIQFNAQGSDGKSFIQGALQFYNGSTPFTDLQLYELNGQQLVTLRFFSSRDAVNPLPLLSGLEPDYVFILAFNDDGKSVTLDLTVARQPIGQPQVTLWESGQVAFNLFREPLIVTLSVVGFGSSLSQAGQDSATFTSGRFLCEVEGDCSDMAYTLALPLGGAPMTPCGQVSQYTDESSNLGYFIVPSSESQQFSVSFEARLGA